MRSRSLDLAGVAVVLFLFGAFAATPRPAVAVTAVATDEADEETLERVPHDPPRKPQGPERTAPPARVEAAALTSVQVNVRGGFNIVGDAANEPTLAVDPTNPNRLAIGWRQFDTVLSDFRQAGYAYSRDAGRTWHFPGVLQPGVFRSDPVLAFDSQGRFYYSSLTSGAQGLRADLFSSSNGGMTWFGPMDAYGGDKQWIAIDRSGGIGQGNLYETWSLVGSCCGRNIFTRSTDGGGTFEMPVTVPSTPLWGTMDVSRDGTLYIAGSAGGDMTRLAVVRSTTINDASYIPFFDFKATVNLGGFVIAPLGDESPNPDGLLGQAWIAVDPSTGPRAGWLYLVCSVDPPGDDPCDVMFARSTDQGASWSEPVRLNDDPPGGWNWMATMSVAPNGRIDVVWNDTRNTGDLTWSELHYCVSVDGGTHWSPNARISPAWNSHAGWPQQHKIGDYYHMISDRVGANLAYAATFNGEQDVWFLRLGDFDCNGNGVGDEIDIAAHTSTDWNANRIPDECEGLVPSDVATAPGRDRLFQNVPNPFNPATEIPFEVEAAGPVRLEIVDVAGRAVRTLAVHAVAGRNRLRWDGTDANGRPVGSGVYLYRLQTAGWSATRRMVLAR